MKVSTRSHVASTGNTNSERIGTIAIAAMRFLKTPAKNIRERLSSTNSTHPPFRQPGHIPSQSPAARNSPHMNVYGCLSPLQRQSPGSHQLLRPPPPILAVAVHPDPRVLESARVWQPGHRLGSVCSVMALPLIWRIHPSGCDNYCQILLPSCDCVGGRALRYVG